MPVEQRNANKELVRLCDLKKKLKYVRGKAAREVLEELINIVSTVTQQTYSGIQGFGEWRK